MSRIVWLASYPKSGNTWLRALLTNYLYASDGPADINDLLGGPIASDRHTFDELTGVESADWSAGEVARWRPDAYRVLSAEADGRLFIKAHDARRVEGVELFPGDATDLAIYIVRNPLDVAVSLASHLDTSVDNTVRQVCQGLTLARSGERLRDQLQQVALSWSEHVTSWTGDPGFPCHVVRFEDLLEEPVATFGRVLSELGESIDHVRLVRAVAHSSFDALREQERRGGFAERLSKSSPFFRMGRHGAWQDVLSQDHRDAIWAANGTVMRRLGYRTE